MRAFLAVTLSVQPAVFPQRSKAFAAVLVVTGMAWAAHGETPTFAPEEIEFFENRIRPVLAENCYDCHAGKKAKIGLHLDSRAGWLKGGDYRTVIDRENPGKSIALLAIKHEGAAAKAKNMPEKGDKLSPEVIADFEKWIAMGLPWPDEGKSFAEERTRGKNHWAFQTVVSPQLPENHSGNPIDFFLDRKLAEAELEPADRADRATLFRRAHFDLLGLPPKFEERKAFVEDPRPDSEAWPALIDHLMASPHFGERQARHWMDVARYSDTKGYEAGGRERRFVYSHTYRDWLIRSFNDDLPYDQFILYQLAADQLVDRSVAEEKPHLAAMGFLTLSKNGNSEEVFADRIDTTFRGFQALTVGCARCHDHKSDPIETEEYYGIYGVLLNSVNPPNLPVIGEPKSGPKFDAYQKELAKKQKVVSDFLDPKLAEIAKKHPNLAGKPGELRRRLERADSRKLQDLQRVVDKFVADSQMEPDKALILIDRDSIQPQHVFIRGSSARRGEIAPRRFLSLIAGPDAPEFKKGSGRLEMAQAIADPSNPLTARVIVNRTWMQHFGEGLVRTVSDFGIEGDTPSHPELLDWLSHWFVENGWSLKKLHRLILTSEAWQRSSVHSGALDTDSRFAIVDPENRLLWKQNRRRLDFEQMHDSLLDVAAHLSNEQFGPSVKLLQPPFANRRAVYAYIDRQNVDPTFRIFDFSNPQEHTGKRPSTSIPMQALFAMNSPFVQEQARRVLTRPEVQSTTDSLAKIDALHRSILGREADETDLQLAMAFLQEADHGLASFGERQTLGSWEYGYGFVDPETEAVVFRPFEHFTGEKWQVAEEYPLKGDPRSYLAVGKTGHAHSGSNLQHSLVLRWTAPRSLTVSVSGTIERSEGVIGKGDGLTGKIILSGQGTVRNQLIPPDRAKQPMNLAEISVKEGDVLSFVVEPNGNNSFDSFHWRPEIREKGADPGETWNFASQFSGPLELAESWEIYSQALLGTNEFTFID